MRLQLRSSLVKPAKKVIGKQRLTVLVNVSFPAPDTVSIAIRREGKHRKKATFRVAFFVCACLRSVARSDPDVAPRADVLAVEPRAAVLDGQVHVERLLRVHEVVIVRAVLAIQPIVR